ERAGDAEPCVVDALLVRVLGEVVQRVAAHLAVVRDQAPLPLELDAARRARRRRGALMGDAQADQRGIEDVDARLAEAPRQRTREDDALVLPAFGGDGHVSGVPFYAKDQRDSMVQTPMATKPMPATSLRVCGRTKRSSCAPTRTPMPA